MIYSNKQKSVGLRETIWTIVVIMKLQQFGDRIRSGWKEDTISMDRNSANP